MSILMIVNPASGRFDKNKIQVVSDILKSKFGDVTIKYTEGRGHAKLLSMESKEDIIVACGGDGLINESASGLIGSEKLFSALPFGTANVFCNEHLIPINVIKAAKIMRLDNHINIPVGFIGDIPFLMMVGFGFDAETVEKIHKSEKRFKFKSLAHIVSGINVIFRKKFNPFYVYHMGSKLKMYHMIVSLGRCYGGNFHLGDVKIGHFNVFMIRNKSTLSLLKSFFSVFSGFGFRGERIVCDCLKVDGVNKCQIDGEFVEFPKQTSFIKLSSKPIKFVF